jgi:cobalt-zinc-cadmium resistance protein CzcA
MSLLDQVVDGSVRHRAAVIVTTLAVAVVAILRLGDLRFDAFPDLTNVQVQVVTGAPGLAAEEVEGRITIPLERAIGGVPGMTDLRSLSRSGVSSVTVVFEDGTDLWHARQLVKERLDAAREAIPADAGVPEIAPPSTGLGEVWQFTLSSDRDDLSRLYEVFVRDVAPRLRTVKGVVEVNAWASGLPQLEARVDPYALAGLGLALSQVEAAITSHVGLASAGALPGGAEATAVRAVSLPDTPEALAAIPVAPGVRLGDIAETGRGRSIPLGLGTADGQGEVVFGMVQLLAGADARSTVADVRARIAEIQATLPEGVVLEPIYDRERLVGATLGTVERSLIEGGLLVVVALLALLGDLRAGLLVASVIPLAMLGAFTGLAFFGMTGNLMSLGAIDFGLVVDGTIVVVESVLAMHQARDRAAAVASRARAVARPVLFAVGLLLLAWLPILAMTGTEGRLFRPMAITVLLALGTALVLTFTWVPAIGAYALHPHGEHNTAIVAWSLKRYQPALDRLLARPRVAGVIGGLLAAVGLAVGAQLGLEFTPRLEEGDLVVQSVRLPSISTDEALRGSTRIETVLRQFPEVLRVASRSGSPAVATDPMGLEEADVLVHLKPKEEWTTAPDLEGLVTAMDEALRAADPTAIYGFTQPIEMRFSELLEGITSDVGVVVYGPDLDKLTEIGRQVAAALERVPGAADVKAPAVDGVPSIDVDLDPAALAAHAVPATEALGAVEALQRGRVVAKIPRDGRPEPIVVELALPDGVDVADTPVIWDGATHTLGDLATVSRTDRAAVVRRHLGSRRVIVPANVRGRDLGGFVDDARAEVAKISLPPGYHLDWKGRYEQLAAALSRTMITVPTALVGMVILLWRALGTFRAATLVLLALPVATSGGAVALWIRDLPISMSAIVGFVALGGIAAMNGVVLVSRTRELHKHHDAADAARMGALERFRPVASTALVAGLGFVPMAIAHGVGAEVQRPLATVVIGGLLTSTPLTLLVLPSMYAAFFRHEDRTNPHHRHPDVDAPAAETSAGGEHAAGPEAA